MAASAFEAKRRRQRLVIAVGGVALVVLLAFQAPTLASLVGGGDTAAPVFGSSPAAPAPEASALAAARGREIAAPRVSPVDRLRAKDPFVPHIVPVAAAVAAPLAAPGTLPTAAMFGGSGVKPLPALPARKRERFVRRVKVARTRDGYTVILRSIPMSQGGAEAERQARRLRRAGLQHVAVIRSSSYSSLRPGFYVVISGRYRSSAAAETALERAGTLAAGAYPRALAR